MVVDIYVPKCCVCRPGIIVPAKLMDHFQVKATLIRGLVASLQKPNVLAGLYAVTPKNFTWLVSLGERFYRGESVNDFAQKNLVVGRFGQFKLKENAVAFLKQTMGQDPTEQESAFINKILSEYLPQVFPFEDRHLEGKAALGSDRFKFVQTLMEFKLLNQSLRKVKDALGGGGRGLVFADAKDDAEADRIILSEAYALAMLEEMLLRPISAKQKTTYSDHINEIMSLIIT